METQDKCMTLILLEFCLMLQDGLETKNMKVDPYQDRCNKVKILSLLWKILLVICTEQRA